MKQKSLGELITFIPGINPTRAEKQFGVAEIDYYDRTAFEYDFHCEERLIESAPLSLLEEGVSLAAGDVVINNSLQLAAIVGCGNAGKVPSLNFTKVQFNTDELDKGYFVYLYNAYSGVRRQKERELQGSTVILRIPIKALEQITIPVVSMEEQKRIGKIYRETSKLQGQLKHYTELLGRFVDRVLEENLKVK